LTALSTGGDRSRWLIGKRAGNDCTASGVDR